MNPLMVKNWESALAAFGIGVGVAVVVTLFSHYASATVSSLANTVAGTTATS